MIKLLDLYEIDWSKFPTSKDPENVVDPQYKQKMAARKKALGQQSASSQQTQQSRQENMSWDEFMNKFPEPAREFKKMQDEWNDENADEPEDEWHSDDDEFNELDGGYIEQVPYSPGIGSRPPQWFWLPDEKKWKNEEEMSEDELKKVGIDWT